MKVIKVEPLPNGNLLLFIDGTDVELTKAEAEKVSIELGFAIQDMDVQERGEGEVFK